MIKIVSHPFHQEFMTKCATSLESIKLCAPFVKGNIIEEIYANISKNVSLSLITNINLQSFHKKYSDISAVAQTIENDGAVYNCTTLHAKIYIFDDKYCFISSANLTSSGLNRNIECGIITDDYKLVGEAVEIYSHIIQNECVGKISRKSIDELSNILFKLPKPQTIQYPYFDLSATYSGDILPIAEKFKGWKKSVFIEINNLCSDEFSTSEVSVFAEKLKGEYPNNPNVEHRKAKIRQVLQQLRDLGLVEFTSPGKYKRLWIKGDNI